MGQYISFRKQQPHLPSRHQPKEFCSLLAHQEGTTCSFPPSSAMIADRSWKGIPPPFVASLLSLSSGYSPTLASPISLSTMTRKPQTRQTSDQSSPAHHYKSIKSFIHPHFITSLHWNPAQSTGGSNQLTCYFKKISKGKSPPETGLSGRKSIFACFNRCVLPPFAPIPLTFDSIGNKTEQQPHHFRLFLMEFPAGLV